jgi:hypothetical protein
MIEIVPVIYPETEDEPELIDPFDMSYTHLSILYFFST